MILEESFVNVLNVFECLNEILKKVLIFNDSLRSNYSCIVINFWVFRTKCNSVIYIEIHG